MYFNIIIMFFLFLVLGVLFNFLLFKNDKSKNSNKKFLSSERFLIFIVEILIAVIGFGVTLAITNANERQIEKDKALHTIEQTIEFTDKQIKRDSSYMSSYLKGKLTNKVYTNSNVISLDYYKNIMSNEVILQNANMTTYGEIMTYLLWLEHYDTKAKIASDNSTEDECYEKENSLNSSSVYANMYYRHKYLKKVRELLWICYQELSGEISSEEAQNKCYEVKYETTTQEDTQRDKTDDSSVPNS